MSSLSFEKKEMPYLLFAFVITGMKKVTKMSAASFRYLFMGLYVFKLV